MKKINIYFLLLALLSSCILNAQELQLTVPDMTVDPGQSFSIDVKASDFDNIESMQFALFWDPSVIEFQSVSNLNSNMPDFSQSGNFNFANAANGRFRMLWFWSDIITNEGVTLEDNSTLFSINYKAIGAQGANSMVEIAGDTLGVTQLEVQIGSAGQEIGYNIDNGKVTISGATASEETVTDDFTLFQNSPNPFQEITYISFNLSSGATAKLTIFDSVGKTILHHNKFFPAGISRIPVRRDMLTSAGSYFYTLETERATATRQLIMQ